MLFAAYECFPVHGWRSPRPNCLPAELNCSPCLLDNLLGELHELSDAVRAERETNSLIYIAVKQKYCHSAGLTSGLALANAQNLLSIIVSYYFQTKFLFLGLRKCTKTWTTSHAVYMTKRNVRISVGVSLLYPAVVRVPVHVLLVLPLPVPPDQQRQAEKGGQHQQAAGGRDADRQQARHEGLLPASRVPLATCNVCLG